MRGVLDVRRNKVGVGEEEEIGQEKKMQERKMRGWEGKE